MKNTMSKKSGVLTQMAPHKAGFGWADLCTFLVSCGLDIVSKGQDVTGGPRVYLKAYFTTVIDCAGYES